jgi:arsenite-transporting ATPase
VGKTTVATAYALYASAKKKVVLISTDPAHSIADVLDREIPPGMQKVGRNLHVWQVDAGARFKEFLDRYREAITALVEQGTFLSRAEIESFLETTLPGLAEVSALLTLSDLLESREFDEIVVDTAPIGHTLQLFRIPEQLARFLDFLELSGRRDQILAAHFGGTARIARPKVLDEWDAVLARLRSALAGGESKVVMVSSAERFSLEEAARTADILRKESKVEISAIVLNRVVLTDQRAGNCGLCADNAKKRANAVVFMQKKWPKVPLFMGPDSGFPLLGAADLRTFGAHVFAGKPLKIHAKGPKHPSVRFKKTRWPVAKTRLSLTVGKGGVGKTTLSGGLVYARRRHNRTENLLICSTDPAPSLDDLFETDVGAQPGSVLGDPHMAAVEVDSTAEYLAWARKVKRIIAGSLQAENAGLHVELSFEHEMISALLDIVPPGVDEIFAVFKLLDLLEAKKLALVVDMAPTGHALELLRTPERLVVWTRLLLKSLSAHRKLPLAQELAVEIASISQRARELADLLKDPKQATAYAVMLPEPLPDRQTGRLIASLKELGMNPAAVFVNRILPLGDVKGCARCEAAAAWQRATLARLRESGDGTVYYAVPDFRNQISGAAGLRRLTQKLWQIA